MDTLIVILLILLVILIFNFVIFIHELGHFLAAKWRGMHVDRFQIWFGKPIWKKKIGGVQYGLGWIPAGGFVSLPQMASMEGIEGSVDEGEKRNLKPAKPWDRIIVAFAGPLFSFGLAAVAACFVWVLGVPDDKVATTTIGYISENSPAKGILQVGDKILKVEGNPVKHWIGKMEGSVQANVVLSEGETVELTIERSGKVMEVSTPYVIPEVNLLDRAYRSIGIYPLQQLVVGRVLENSPAEVAGILKGDIITSYNGEPLRSYEQFSEKVRSGEPAVISLLRDQQQVEIEAMMRKPRGFDTYAFGVAWNPYASKYIEANVNFIYPTPAEQLKEQVKMMWTTITKIISTENDVNLGHAQSAIGIANNYYTMLQQDSAFNKVLWFTVLLNVNLAILNLLPLPVLDGGHITTSLIEIITRRPVPTKVMLVLQNSFVLLLLGFMLYVGSKDIFAISKGDGDSGSKPREMIFDPPKVEVIDGVAE